MDREFLEKMGISKENVDAIMGEYGKTKGELEALKGDLQTAEKERDSYKDSLEDVNKQLESMESVDVDTFKAQIDELKADIETKEQEHKEELAVRDFHAVVSSVIREAQGKNEKAVMALLDLEKLKGSSNQKEDVAAAVAELKKEEDYLFGEAGGPPPYADGSGTGEMHASDDPFTRRAEKYTRR